MRYSTQPKFRKYVKGYGFFSFARKSGDKYGKKLMDTRSRQMLVPRTSQERPPTASPGRPLKILFDRPRDVPI